MDKTTNEVYREKYKDRGWTIGKDNIRRGGKFDTGVNIDHTSYNEIPKLPLSPEEYKTFALLLSKMCIEDKNPDLCDLYFEIQRRAFFANGYEPIEGINDIEKQIADIGINPEKYQTTTKTDGNKSK